MEETNIVKRINIMLKNLRREDDPDYESCNYYLEKLEDIKERLSDLGHDWVEELDEIGFDDDYSFDDEEFDEIGDEIEEQLKDILDNLKEEKKANNESPTIHINQITDSHNLDYKDNRNIKLEEKESDAGDIAKKIMQGIGETYEKGGVGLVLIAIGAVILIFLILLRQSMDTLTFIIFLIVSITLVGLGIWRLIKKEK